MYLYFFSSHNLCGQINQVLVMGRLDCVPSFGHVCQHAADELSSAKDSIMSSATNGKGDRCMLSIVNQRISILSFNATMVLTLIVDESGGLLALASDQATR